MNEWRRIPGFSDYEVSRDGRVRSWKRYGPGDPPHVLSPKKRQNGYQEVNIFDDNDTKNHILVHRLVALTFLGIPASDEEVNHKDGDKGNNHANNLEYVSRQENVDHALRSGFYAVCGERNSNSRLAEGEVELMREIYHRGIMTQAELADSFGVTQSHVSSIVRGESWSSTPGPTVG